jgi:aerobic-type carbon monoxide dehydrogenase small subunit (CoxS/CutS family)
MKPLSVVKPLQLYNGTSSTSTQTQTVTVDPYAAQSVTLNVNGANYTVSVEPRDMLVNVLREDIGLIGTKRPCNRMQCGGCAVIIDGALLYSCTYPAIRLGNGQKILTTEAGVGAKSPDPVISALQQAWVTEDAGQCAYCGPGQIMSAAALLKVNANPTVAQIKTALSGNLCRCGAYIAIIAAVQAAATNLKGTGV